MTMIVEWMTVRRQIELPLLAPLFCTQSGRATTAAYIRRLLPRLAAKAGIEKRVHAYGLRHTTQSKCDVKS